MARPGALCGVILAGGQARRMGGRDKAFLELGGRRLANRAADRLGPQVAGLAIASNAPADRFDLPGVTVLPDGDRAGMGPLAGIAAGLDWAAARGAGALVTVAVDTPFFPADLVARLGAAAQANGAALAESATGLHPTFGLWPVACRGRLADYLQGGGRRVRPFAESIGAVPVRFDGAPDPFFNVNTPEDLAQAERMLTEARS